MLRVSAQPVIGVILLAAGSSSRLGTPKQLLQFEGKSLLQNAIDAALKSSASELIVVLGAQADQLRDEIQDPAVHVVYNEAWQEGMASSIRTGINAFVGRHPDADAVILMVCDQPHVSSDLLNEMIAVYKQTAKPIVACGYDNTYGPPTLFHSGLFHELLELKGDKGARMIVAEHSGSVEIVPFPNGEVDVDTEADYERIKSAGSI